MTPAGQVHGETTFQPRRRRTDAESARTPPSSSPRRPWPYQPLLNPGAAPSPSAAQPRPLTWLAPARPRQVPGRLRHPAPGTGTPPRRRLLQCAVPPPAPPQPAAGVAPERAGGGPAPPAQGELKSCSYSSRGNNNKRSVSCYQPRTRCFISIWSPGFAGPLLSRNQNALCFCLDDNNTSIKGQR